MQLYPDKLANTLGQSSSNSSNVDLKSVYLIFGDEPYQKTTSIDLIRATAKQQGFEERTSMLAASDFDWSRLVEATQSLSLFSAKQMIELELPTGKPGKEGAKILLSIANTLSLDTLLVVHGPRVGKDVQNTKWFKALASQGDFVPCYPQEGHALNNWLSSIATQKRCRMDRQAIALLAEFCEGNMLAGAQEIEKLALHINDREINAKDVESLVVNQSRYNVFQLIDAFLAGDGKKTAKLLLALESEGLEAPIILWALVKEWQTLSELKTLQGPINWQKYRIWGNRQRLYQSALSRLTNEHLKKLGKHLSYADGVFKRQVVVRPYVSLCFLCLLFVNPQLDALGWEA